MADPVATTFGARESAVDRSSSASLFRSTLVVIAFWWTATGLTFAMQRSSAALAVTLVATSLLAIVGAILIGLSRDDSTPRGARRAFLGASFVWWWAASVFYAGWGAQLDAGRLAPPGTFALARQAIAATLRADTLGLVALIAIAIGVWRARNRVALWAFFTFWATLQTAKLNVFFGVRNSGVELLPPQLAGLASFFGPARNTVLLPITTALLAIACVVLIERARRTHDLFVRHACAMLAMLVALAVLEHALLGASLQAPLWDLFLSRGS